MGSSDRQSFWGIGDASALTKYDGIATHWVSEHSDERCLVLLDIYNLENLSLHGTYGCEAIGGNILRSA